MYIHIRSTHTHIYIHTLYIYIYNYYTYLFIYVKTIGHPCFSSFLESPSLTWPSMVEAEFAELSPIWWEAVENVDPRLIVSIGSLGQLKKTDRLPLKVLTPGLLYHEVELIAIHSDSTMNSHSYTELIAIHSDNSSIPGSHWSMNWFKGKSSPKTIDFPMKYGA